MVLADAAKYLPQEPVDFVICEMLHSAMLREKQLNVLAKFRANYLAMLSPTLPRFIPEVAFLAVQPVQHPYDFFGYNCPIPVFQDALTVHPDTVELGDPVIYSSIDYAQHIPLRLQWRGAARVSRGGRLTALRFVTKNILAVLTDESRAIDWHNAYLLLPLPEPIDVETGTQLSIRFDYPAGAPIAALAESMRVEILPDAPQVTIRPRQGVVVAE
jgi:predicted RNA methylase